MRKQHDPSELRARLRLLGDNLWWSWDRRLETIFCRIDADLWEATGHNPTAFSIDVSDDKLREHAGAIAAPLAKIERALRAYMEPPRTWASQHCRGLAASTIAYFSPEFCIHESLPIYSGGLGVLAGDHLKSCSDLGIATVGVSLLYRHGYFRQHIRKDGWQAEEYEDLDPDRAPITRVRTAQGKPVSVHVPLGLSVIAADLWQVQVGRCRLLLLDPHQYPESVLPGALRLYGGDSITRLVQEVVLGIGGYRALKAVGIRPSVLHMNEGHSAFAAFEAIADRMEETGLPFDQAATDVASAVVFTTHTPVEAGHDRFAAEPLLAMLAPVRKRLGLTPQELLAFGRVHPEDEHETFCMTVCAMKLARHTNAVSSLHGHVSRRMWKRLWPQRRELEVPIGHVTNGVHVATWLAPELAELYGRNLAREAFDPTHAEGTRSELMVIDEDALWRTKRQLKARLLEFVKARAAARYARLGLTEPVPDLHPEALTIGLARRFALYKRALLPFHDYEHLRELVTDRDRPVQFLVAGKAHPADEPAKKVIAAIHELTLEQGLQHRVVFVEGYDQAVSRMLLAGCDLWLNVPRRPLEACGTSGMKAVLNATLNCSTLDGWWDEAYDGAGGFAVGDGSVHVDPAVQDERDSIALMSVLENEVVPLFYERGDDGIPMEWLARVKHALATMAYRYSADRMVLDYGTRLYAPAAGRVSAEIRD
ncbi:MAG TPA: alpha-glucan family phosphorylase [Candidatus Limnocylindrales bacterium]|nr:alpha-glucan family phosphorylase [Candidatus Limnocylindrales bacterium]